MTEPCQNPNTIRYSALMARSFRHCAGEPLLAQGDALPPEALAQALYDTPFVLVSHGTQADPIFCYANRAAQTLWEYDWDMFTRLPSRLSAEADARSERAGLLEQALQQGIIRNYSGMRVSRTGKRFEIRNALLWNVTDENGRRIGQAAMFHDWTMV